MSTTFPAASEFPSQPDLKQGARGVRTTSPLQRPLQMMVEGRLSDCPLQKLSEAIVGIFPGLVSAEELTIVPQEMWGDVLNNALRMQTRRRQAPVRLILEDQGIDWDSAANAIRSLEKVPELDVLMLVRPRLGSATQGRPAEWNVFSLLVLATIPAALAVAATLWISGAKENVEHSRLLASPYAGEIYPAVRSAAHTEAIPMEEREAGVSEATVEVLPILMKEVSGD